MIHAVFHAFAKLQILMPGEHAPPHRHTMGALRFVMEGDGADTAFVELLGSEKVVEEKREKRAEIRSKRAEEAKRAMDEAEAQGGVEHPTGTHAEGEDKIEK